MELTTGALEGQQWDNPQNRTGFACGAISSFRVWIRGVAESPYGSRPSSGSMCCNGTCITDQWGFHKQFIPLVTVLSGCVHYHSLPLESSGSLYICATDTHVLSVNSLIISSVLWIIFIGNVHTPIYIVNLHCHPRRCAPTARPLCKSDFWGKGSTTIQIIDS